MHVPAVRRRLAVQGFRLVPADRTMPGIGEAMLKCKTWPRVGAGLRTLDVAFHVKEAPMNHGKETAGFFPFIALIGHGAHPVREG